MVRVMATGIFDLLHLGHIHFLQEASKHGDELIVVVATDQTAERNKHLPITPEETRVELVNSLKVVDKAYLGHNDDPYRIVEELRPDIIALGFDQYHDATKIRAELEKRGLGNIKVVRLQKFDHDLNGTRKIIRKIIEESSRFRTLN